MSDFLDVSALDEGGRAALRRLLITLADTKRVMGIRYSDWLLGAPSIETGIATSSMAQDEWGHASLDALDEPVDDWAAVIAAMVVVDGAMTTALEAFSRGNFEPATSRVPKMLSEEEFHTSLARAWYRRLAGSQSASARGKLKDATEAMLPAVLAWLGAADASAQALVDAGVTDSGADQVAAFRDSVRDVLAEGGVDVDAVEPASEWDEARGRGPGHPGNEATERARGDRNRMLFVE